MYLLHSYNPNAFLSNKMEHTGYSNQQVAPVGKRDDIFPIHETQSTTLWSMATPEPFEITRFYLDFVGKFCTVGGDSGFT